MGVFQTQLMADPLFPTITAVEQCEYIKAARLRRELKRQSRMNLPAEDIMSIVDQTYDLWPLFKNKRIFVTGGTGFVGQWMLESFVAANKRFNLGATAIVQTRDIEKARRKFNCPEFVQWTRYPWGPEFGDTYAVLHLATANEPTVEGLEFIVNSTKDALSFARSSLATRFLFTSSGAAATLRPGYEELGVAKRYAEILCQKQGGVTARLFSFVGPGLPLDGKFAIGNFIGDACAQRAINVKGNPGAVRSYMYASDLAVWLWHLLVRGTPGEIYDVGSEDEISIKSLAKTVSRVVGDHGIDSVGTSKPDIYLPNTDKAAQLGLKETISLEDAIRMTAAWHKQKSLGLRGHPPIPHPEYQRPSNIK